MKKFILPILVATLLLTSCKGQIESNIDSGVESNYKPKVVALKGPTYMGMVPMSLEEDKNFELEVLGAPDEAVSKIVSKETDIASVPANLAATLYNKTEGEVKVLAVNTLGVLYVVENGNTINTVEDLKGKTVYMTGKGATPEYTFTHILEKAGILDDVKIEYKTEHTELALMLETDKTSVAVLPEPFASNALSANKNLRVALDLNKEWKKIDTEGDMITGVIIARDEVIDEHKDKVIEFLDDYKDSIEFVNSGDESIPQMMVDAKLVPNTDIAKSVIPRCNITYIDGDDMKSKLSSYLDILFNKNPKSVGGAKVDDEFYFKK